MKNKRQLKKHIIKNKKRLFNYNFNIKMINKRNKINTISFKRKQNIKPKQLINKPKYIKYINYKI